MTILILAGGFATRLWPLTEQKAKPLLPVAGKPIISHIVDQLPTDQPILISTNQVFEVDFMKWKKEYGADKNIEIFIEDSGKSDDEKRGALGATAYLLKEKNIQDDVLLIAGDNLCGFSMESFQKSFRGNPLLAVYDIQDREEAKKYGVVKMEEGKIVEFLEKPLNPPSSLISTGCYLFPKETLADIFHYASLKKDDLGGIFEYFLEQQKTVDAFVFEEYWYDIGSFQSYMEAHKKLSPGLQKKSSLQEAGNNEYEGAVFLDAEVQIKNSILADSLVLASSTIENCILRNCIIDENCELKNIDLQGKMIRKGTKISG